MEVPPPSVGVLAFANIAPDALVKVNPECQASYGDTGTIWRGLIINEKAECDTETLRNTITTLIAQLAQKDAQIAQKDAEIVELEKRPTESDIEELTNSITTLVAQLAQKDTQIAQLEQRPTQAAYDQVVAELDARPTFEDFQEARAGSVIVTPTQNGTVIFRMMIEESSDLSSWEQSEESVEVELPLAEGKKFLRFAMSSEN